MGILPLEYNKGDTAESLGLTGKEIDTEPEIEYFKDGGILIYVMKKLMH